MTRIRHALANTASALVNRWFKVAAAPERGTSYIEYVVMAAVALIALLGVIQVFFGAISGLFSRLTGLINGI
jgi:Flp pilus assembly pilin Flp